ncbi:S-layer homology domain-containing protein [Actinomycetaceae bacterium TAE3-ERU4]|nr:S-layer homology domain-containing protein [Actinomycetaceae bacterium TAE3-ERU4]
MRKKSFFRKVSVLGALALLSATFFSFPEAVASTSSRKVQAFTENTLPFSPKAGEEDGFRDSQVAPLDPAKDINSLESVAPSAIVTDTKEPLKPKGKESGKVILQAEVSLKTKVNVVGVSWNNHAAEGEAEYRLKTDGKWGPWSDLEGLEGPQGKIYSTESVPLIGGEAVQVRMEVEPGQVEEPQLVVTSAEHDTWTTSLKPLLYGSDLPANAEGPKYSLPSFKPLAVAVQEASYRSAPQPIEKEVTNLAENGNEVNEEKEKPPVKPRPALPEDAIDGMYNPIPYVALRSEWKANAKWTDWPTEYGKTKGVVFHHTAGSNNYTREQVPLILLSIQRFHAITRRWGDIGYNVLVDRFGQAWQGRQGRVMEHPIGAHAYGANTYTYGISVIGDYMNQPVSPETREMLVKLTAWKLSQNNLNPRGKVTLYGKIKGHKTPLTVPIISGHRQVGATDCPGDAFFAQIPGITEEVAKRMDQLKKESFNDVPVASFFWDYITWMRSSGYSVGWPDGTYRPQQKVSRVAALAFLYRRAGSPKMEKKPNFKDVNPNSVFASAIAWGQQNGITTGWPNGTFHPVEPVSREAMAAFMYRFCKNTRKCTQTALAALEREEKHSRQQPSGFKDVKPGDLFTKEIRWMSESGISLGWEDKTFRPYEHTSRAAMAAFFYRLIARPALEN